MPLKNNRRVRAQFTPNPSCAPTTKKFGPPFTFDKIGQEKIIYIVQHGICGSGNSDILYFQWNRYSPLPYPDYASLRRDIAYAETLSAINFGN